MGANGLERVDGFILDASYLPPTLHMGAEAARPAISRLTTNVAIFGASALGRVKMK